MAQTPQAVRSLLERVWKPARARALADRDAAAGAGGGGGGQFRAGALGLALLRREAQAGRANFDDAAIKPYLALDHMIEAAFDCASRLFGLSFSERKDVPVVSGLRTCGSGRSRTAPAATRRCSTGDCFARPSRASSGAWMALAARSANSMATSPGPDHRCCNFSRKGAEGEPRCCRG